MTALTRHLGMVPLFSGLDEEQLTFVARHLQQRSYEERDIIVERDSPGDALFILTEGKVKVSYREDEGETIIAVLRAGEFFGELSVLDGEGRSADVVALEPTHVLFLSSDDFRTCLHTVP